MHRPTVHNLRSARLPRRWRTLLAAAAVTAAVVPAAQAAAVIPAQARPHPPASTPADPPPVTVLTQGADNGNGDIFIAPFGDSTTYANGPEIINNAGQVLWFHPVPAGEEAADFRPQIYDGRPVLTWWQGTGLGGLSSGTDYIYNDHFQQIATVSAGTRPTGTNSSSHRGTRR
jgi:opacity protein-like surface antigen